jgi:uracil-DNA glycosylase
VRTHTSGVPWDDRSGTELRRWLGVTPAQFYDSGLFAFLPMGFCYPGSKPTGDLPPRPECAPCWHRRVLDQLQHVGLTLLIGQYAQRYYLRQSLGITLTETVRQYRTFQPSYWPLVHPSPRNRAWQVRNPWFESEMLPELQCLVRQLIEKGTLA